MVMYSQTKDSLKGKDSGAPESFPIFCLKTSLKKLPNGTDIFVFPPAYYLTAKFEAHNDRRGNDLRQSHDFEDIIYVMGNCTELIDNIIDSDFKLKLYLKNKCQNLLEIDNLTEGIETALPYGSDSDSTEIIERLIQQIAENEFSGEDF